MINKTEEDIISSWEKKNNDIPLVSIRCATYNHELYISDALDGFLSQITTFPFEIIVHDDASKDDTAKIVENYEKKYPKIIKAIYEKENQYSKHDGSLTRIINNACRGKYVAFCEGDDYWIDENKLQNQVEFLEKHNTFSAYYCNVNGVDLNNNEMNYVYKIYPLYNTHIIEKNNSNYIGLIGQTATCVIRNELLKKYPFDVSLECNGDIFYSTIARAAGDVFYSEKKMAAHRKCFSGSSWTAQNLGKNMILHYYKSAQNIMDYSSCILNKTYLNRNFFLACLIFQSLKVFLEKRNQYNKETFIAVLKLCDFKGLLFFYFIKALIFKVFNKFVKLRAKNCKKIY